MSKTIRVSDSQAKEDLTWEGQARENRRKREERTAIFKSSNALESVQAARKVWADISQDISHMIDGMDAKQVTIAWQDAAEAVNKAKMMQEVELNKVAEKNK